eukprot:1383986-Amphidinium_carterae.1
MRDDMCAIDDAEALRVWSELSELDPKIRGDTYVTEDGSQWSFSDLVDDLKVMQERRRKEREATTPGEGSTLLSSDGRGERAEAGVLSSSGSRQQQQSAASTRSP